MKDQRQYNEDVYNNETYSEFKEKFREHHISEGTYHCHKEDCERTERLEVDHKLHVAVKAQENAQFKDYQLLCLQHHWEKTQEPYNYSTALYRVLPKSDEISLIKYNDNEPETVISFTYTELENWPDEEYNKWRGYFGYFDWLFRIKQPKAVVCNKKDVNNTKVNVDKLFNNKKKKITSRQLLDLDFISLHINPAYNTALMTIMDRILLEQNAEYIDKEQEEEYYTANYINKRLVQLGFTKIPKLNEILNYGVCWGEFKKKYTGKSASYSRNHKQSSICPLVPQRSYSVIAICKVCSNKKITVEQHFEIEEFGEALYDRRCNKCHSKGEWIEEGEDKNGNVKQVYKGIFAFDRVESTKDNSQILCHAANNPSAWHQLVSTKNE